MIRLEKTNATDPHFVGLVEKLDAELTVRDGDEHDFYDQYNKLDQIKHTIVAFHNAQAVGCGAIKHFDEGMMEIKRMYVLEESRGQGIATVILQALEKWAADLGYQKCCLETGIRQPEAIRLYKKNHYRIIENYGQYKGVENSVCFEKSL